MDGRPAAGALSIRLCGARINGPFGPMLLHMDLLDRLREALEGRYAVKGELGHGGMAVVFRARDLKHGRDVAIKVLRPELAVSLGSDRFTREIEIGAGLSHPNILALHDSGEADGLMYFVTPLPDLESLEDRIEHGGLMALTAAWVPAHRTAGIDAMAALQGDGG